MAVSFGIEIMRELNILDCEILHFVFVCVCVKGWIDLFLLDDVGAEDL